MVRSRLNVWPPCLRGGRASNAPAVLSTIATEDASCCLAIATKSRSSGLMSVVEHLDGLKLRSQFGNGLVGIVRTYLPHRPR